MNCPMYSLTLKGFFSTKNENAEKSAAFNRAYAAFYSISDKSLGKRLDLDVTPVRQSDNVIRTHYERGFVDEVVQGNDLLLIAKEVM